MFKNVSRHLSLPLRCLNRPQGPRVVKAESCPQRWCVKAVPLRSSGLRGGAQDARPKSPDVSARTGGWQVVLTLT